MNESSSELQDADFAVPIALLDFKTHQEELLDDLPICDGMLGKLQSRKAAFPGQRERQQLELEQ